MRTLIVDDEPDMRLLVTMMLTLDGCGEIGEAADGAEALIEWQRWSPDVMVLDMRMQGLSGLEVARLILDQKPTQPIVLWSAYLDAQERQEAHRVGVSAIVDKLNLSQLPHAVRIAAGLSAA